MAIAPGRNGAEARDVPPARRRERFRTFIGKRPPPAGRHSDPATGRGSGIPKSRTEWWAEKIERNRARDRRVSAELEALGWRIITLWTCEFNRVAKREALADSLPDRIEPPAEERDWPLAAEDPVGYGNRPSRS